MLSTNFKIVVYVKTCWVKMISENYILAQSIANGIKTIFTDVPLII